jgi:hypothetical protein
VSDYQAERADREARERIADLERRAEAILAQLEGEVGSGVALYVLNRAAAAAERRRHGPPGPIVVRERPPEAGGAAVDPDLLREIEEEDRLQAERRRPRRKAGSGRRDVGEDPTRRNP